MNPTTVFITSACLLAGLNLRAQVTISSPENGSTVASPVQLSAALSGARLSSMTVYNDGSLLFQQQGISSVATLLTLTPGSHTILVKAIDKSGLTTSAITTVTVTPPEPASSANA